MVGLALFAASSLLCGYAWSPLVLVVFRAAQGLGAAIVAPAALSIISTTFPEGRGRNLAMGLWTAVAAGGGAAGLVLGGLITDVLGWVDLLRQRTPRRGGGRALLRAARSRPRGANVPPARSAWRGDDYGGARASGLRPHPGGGVGLRLAPHAGNYGPGPGPACGLPLR